jgi:hypothetical protein
MARTCTVEYSSDSMASASTARSIDSNGHLQVQEGLEVQVGNTSTVGSSADDHERLGQVL